MMFKRTVSVDDQLIKRACTRAVQQGTLLSARVRACLPRYANQGDNQLQRQRDDATARQIDAIEAATLQSQPAGAAEIAAGQPQHTFRDGLYASGFRATAEQAKPGSTAP